MSNRRGRPTAAMARTRARAALEMHQQGRDAASIAEELGVTTDGVRHILAKIDRQVAEAMGKEAERVRRTCTGTAVRLAADAIRCGHPDAAARLLDSLAGLWPIEAPLALADCARAYSDPAPPSDS